MVIRGAVCALVLTDRDTVRVRSLDGTLTYAETPYTDALSTQRRLLAQLHHFCHSAQRADLYRLWPPSGERSTPAEQER